MKIRNVSFVEGASAFYFDDQRAIKAGAEHDGFAYSGKPVTAGFKRIRQEGKAIVIALELENGRIAYGDCAAVQYSGAGGRDPLLDPEYYIPFLEKNIEPLLVGSPIQSFRQAASELDSLAFIERDATKPRKLHTALRYGLSQALLYARAEELGKIPAEIIAEEWKLPLISDPIPLFGQSGDDRYTNADKMILRGVAALPHALINNVDEKLGRDGEKLREYLRWLSKRIKTLRVDESYKPAIHVDVYGTIGSIFNDDFQKVAEYLASLERDAAPFELYVEGPVDVQEKQAQIDALAQITGQLKKLGSPVKIVADEWCNTLEDIKDFADASCCHMLQIKTPDLGALNDIVDAVLYCKEKGIEAYQGGTCNETDLSARACAQLAMASRPERLLAKPGMGFDEGFSIAKNEMARIGAVFNMRKNHA
ncbi:methylaspartate ammonia-lyase [Treponema sp.]